MKKQFTLFVFFLAGISMLKAQVGIGTTTPASRLEVKGAGTTSATSTLNVTNSSGTSLLFVHDGGNVGIGTTTPNSLAKLHIVGNTGIDKLMVETTVAGGQASLDLLKPGKQYRIIVNAANSYDIYDQTSGASRFTIDQNGNVGIGNTGPATSLHVNGGVTVQSTTINVTADNQVITVGNSSYLRLASNNPGAPSRTIVFSNGLYIGQLLFIECTANALQVLDSVAGSNANTTANLSFGVGDVLQLIWNGTAWTQVSFSNN